MTSVQGQMSGAVVSSGVMGHDIKDPTSARVGSTALVRLYCGRRHFRFGLHSVISNPCSYSYLYLDSLFTSNGRRRKIPLPLSRSGQLSTSHDLLCQLRGHE